MPLVCMGLENGTIWHRALDGGGLLPLGDELFVSLVYTGLESSIIWCLNPNDGGLLPHKGEVLCLE